MTIPTSELDIDHVNVLVAIKFQSVVGRYAFLMFVIPLLLIETKNDGLFFLTIMI